MVKRTVPESDILVTLRLPRDLHAKLREAGGERGMTEQVRSRLQASFESSAEPIKDPALRDLAERIGRAAQAAAEVLVPNQALYGVLAEVVGTLIEEKREKAAPGEMQTTEAGKYLKSVDGAVGWILAAATHWELRDVL